MAPNSQNASESLSIINTKISTLTTMISELESGGAILPTSVKDSDSSPRVEQLATFARLLRRKPNSVVVVAGLRSARGSALTVAEQAEDRQQGDRSTPGGETTEGPGSRLSSMLSEGQTVRWRERSLLEFITEHGDHISLEVTQR